VAEGVRRVSGALATALLAVLAFVVGQAILRFVVEPIQDQRRVIGEIAYALLFYANVYHLDQFNRPDEQRRAELEEARAALRGLAGRLQASLWTVPVYDAWALIGWVRKKGDVLTATRELTGWSNSLYGGKTSEMRDKRRRIIADALGISQKVGPPA